MSATAWDLAANVVEEILAANGHRDHVTVQLHDLTVKGNDPVYLGFGEAAVVGTGLELGGIGDSVRVTGPKARLAVSAVTASIAASGGIETMEDIEYRHTRDYPRWAQA